MPFDLTPDEARLFSEEADDLLQLLEEDFLHLERLRESPEVIEEIFRAAHTLKGSSATIGHHRMASLTHGMENVLDLLRRGELPASEALADTFLRAVDALRLLKAEVVTGRACEEDFGDLLEELSRWSDRSREASQGGRGASPPRGSVGGRTNGAVHGSADGGGPAVATLERAAAGAGEPWRIEVTLAGDCPMPSIRAYQVWLAVEQRGEIAASEPTLEAIERDEVGRGIAIEFLPAAGCTTEALAAAIREIPEVEEVRVEARQVPPAQGKARGGPAPAAQPGQPAQQAPGGQPQPVLRSQTIRVGVEVLDNLMNLVGELVIGRTQLLGLVEEIRGERGGDEADRQLQQASANLALITRELQDEILRARMLPVESLFRKFPRMVRDLARSAGKEIDFVVEGQETELDRSVIEEIGDPLIHLLRNAVDHGLEPPQERLAAGKPATGRLLLSARQEESAIVLSVSDDGRGIDADRVRRSAVSRGLISEEAARRLPHREALELIFAPGLSTREEVSEISGRGVGMDVVKRNIERLGGSIEIETEPGRGTTFRIKLPLTLVITRALLVRVGGETFAIPLSSVAEAIEIDPGAVRWLNQREAILLRGSACPVLRLGSSLHEGRLAKRPQPLAEPTPAVIVRVGGEQAALVVDALIGEQEVVIKGLGGYIGDVPGIAGTAILGDGALALILDVGSLLHLLRRSA